jgi:adenylylsulfate kinase
MPYINSFSKIVWFTGLSGSGKSTLANKLNQLLKKKFRTLRIDGDQIRKKTKKKAFNKSDIIKNNLSIINLINKKKKNYDFIIVSVISPFLKTRTKAKKFFKKNYIEVYVNCPITELVKRDTKGLYKLAKQKKINNLIGYKSKIMYEKSRYKKLSINTKKNNVANSIKIIYKKIFNIKLINK